MSDRRNNHSVRRIVLPSGRAIEVVRFDEAEAQAPAGLHICPSCDCDLVQPTSWSDVPGDQWQLTLECPNCGWSTSGIYTREEVDQLEEKLDDGLVQMLDDLQRLTRANMADEIDRFCVALQADVILPEDF